ncbi:diguanylate cyclase, partial [Amycolatopsis alba DSM 44262]
MGVNSSVPPGADLPMHARDLVRMHEAVIGGGRPRVRPRPLVSRSWSRALSLGLAADGVNTRDSVSLDEVARRRRASPLRHVVEVLGQVLGTTSDTANMLLVVTDAEGVILWRAGSPSVKRRADTLGF